MQRTPMFIDIQEVMDHSAFPYRHVLCPHYDTCLDEAVSKDQYFDCSRCAFKKNDITAYLIHEGEAA